MSLTDYVVMFIDIGKRLIPLLASVAFLAFVWGVAKYIRASGQKNASDSKNLLIWGVIGLFVLVTIWGIVAFLKSELGFGDGLVIPQIKFK